MIKTTQQVLARMGRGWDSHPVDCRAACGALENNFQKFHSLNRATMCCGNSTPRYQLKSLENPCLPTCLPLPTGTALPPLQLAPAKPAWFFLERALG